MTFSNGFSFPEQSGAASWTQHFSSQFLVAQTLEGSPLTCPAEKQERKNAGGEKLMFLRRLIPFKVTACYEHPGKSQTKKLGYHFCGHSFLVGHSLTSLIYKNPSCLNI